MINDGSAIITAVIGLVEVSYDRVNDEVPARCFLNHMLTLVLAYPALLLSFTPRHRGAPKKCFACCCPCCTEATEVRAALVYSKLIWG